MTAQTHEGVVANPDYVNVIWIGETTYAGSLRSFYGKVKDMKSKALAVDFAASRSGLVSLSLSEILVWVVELLGKEIVPPPFLPGAASYLPMAYFRIIDEGFTSPGGYHCNGPFRGTLGVGVVVPHGQLITGDTLTLKAVFE